MIKRHFLIKEFVFFHVYAIDLNELLFYNTVCKKIKKWGLL